jgi:hypothetical protein
MEVETKNIEYVTDSITNKVEILSAIENTGVRF